MKDKMDYYLLTPGEYSYVRDTISEVVAQADGSQDSFVELDELRAFLRELQPVKIPMEVLQ